MKDTGKWYMDHEGPAWTVTALWLAAVALVVYWKGAPYDPSVKLDLAEWANVGTLVSAVVAPIAVLWVVRAFHVQKRELAAAVKAATDQATALARQHELQVQERELSIRPDLRIEFDADFRDAKGPLTVPGGIVAYETMDLEIKNAGRGSAYDARVTVLSWSRDKQRTDTIWKASVFPKDTFQETTFPRPLTEADAPTRHMVITVLATDSTKGAWMHYYAFDMKVRRLLKIEGDVLAHIAGLEDD